MPWVEAHVFCGQGADAYTSLFMQLRYGASRLLFTGDAHMPYERQLLGAFGAEDFRADVLKVTHHGSSSGTAGDVLTAIKPALAFASTAEDEDHRLETDTLKRLVPAGSKRRVFDTLADGDITLRTDGQLYLEGTLWRVELDSPGEFVAALAAGG